MHLKYTLIKMVLKISFFIQTLNLFDQCID